MRLSTVMSKLGWQRPDNRLMTINGNRSPWLLPPGYEGKMSANTYLKQFLKPEEMAEWAAAQSEIKRLKLLINLLERRAAKVLGVAEGTVRNDLRNNNAENAQELRTTNDLTPKLPEDVQESEKSLSCGLQ